MGKERNRLRLERDRLVSEAALAELIELRSEQLREKATSTPSPAAEEPAKVVAKKAPAKAKPRARTTRKKAAKSE